MFRRRKPDESNDDPPSFEGPVDGAGEELRNVAIVEAMRDVSVHDSPETRAMLFQLLLESTLVVATPPTSRPPGMSVTKAGDTLQIVMAQGDEGPVLPVFTSLATLLAWRGEETAYAAMPAVALFQMASAGEGATMAIDPGSPTHGFITRREFEALAHGRLPVAPTEEMVAEETTVRIGVPANRPTPEVFDALRAALTSDRQIVGGWLYLMQQGEQEPELVVGVRFDAAVDADRDASRAAMKDLVDDTANRSEAARTLLFIQADDDLAGLLASGSGIDLLHSDP